MASPAFLKSLSRDQILKATVEDVTSTTELLCNFKGELLLIFNHTGLSFRKGDPIRLQIRSLRPLQFQIFNPGQQQFNRVV